MATALDLSRNDAADLVPVANAFADLIRMSTGEPDGSTIPGNSSTIHAYIVGPGGLGVATMRRSA
jgi:hypothetical protein